MEFNLGVLIETIVEKVQNRKNTTLARVKWIFEKGEIKWGTIAESKYGGLWVQMPKINFGKGWLSPIKITDETLETNLSEEAIKKYNELPDEDEQTIDIDKMVELINI